MVRIIFKVTVLLILLSCCWSAEKIPLWSIDHKEGKVYLLGSIHMLKENLSPYRAAIETAFLDSRILAVEAHIGSGNMLENTAKMMQAGMFAGEDRLNTFLSPQQYRDLDLMVRKMGFDLISYHRYRPWMLALTLSSMAMIRQGYNPLLGVDLHFINRAEERQMEIVELEGVDYQIALFKNMSRDEELAFLFSSIAEYQEQEQIVEKIVSAWKAGDLDGLNSILMTKADEIPELKAFFRTLLHTRNEKMAEKVEHYLADGKRCFVIVGAAHLIGESGIIEILCRKGFTVNRL